MASKKKPAPRKKESARKKAEIKDLPPKEQGQQPTDAQAQDVKGGIWRNGKWYPW